MIIYQLPAIVQSQFFPKLIGFEPSLKGQAGQFFIERLVPLDKFDEAKGVVEKGVEQLVEAVKVLHLTGFVHGHISPGNVGFNPKVGASQLFDFDQSRPIAEASTKSRRGGTADYRSESYETTGIFKPSDDFISLKLTLLWWFKTHGHEEGLDEVIAPIEIAIAGCDDSSVYTTSEQVVPK